MQFCQFLNVKLNFVVLSYLSEIFNAFNWLRLEIRKYFEKVAAQFLQLHISLHACQIFANYLSQTLVALCFMLLREGMKGSRYHIIESS